ncbi:PREDICTED: uncharacterized protein LOC108379836 [Rhagoletis zephyria]|uniref:uncharacterized protein LOC108379836 n=1 Tax=Rhagoletis zephyria TaxID=28612 RepID=UPI0008112DD4|nr:PREDICTED: uncharacterized protein LOC108379836 [Rhagoletis zephyria]
MVESQQDPDNEQDYIDNDEEENELDTYLRTEYLDNCDLYNSTNTNKESEDNESNNPASPAMSTYSRPVSSYRRSEDLDDLFNMTSSSKSQASSQGDSNFMFKSNKSLDAEGLHEELLMA